MTRVMTVSGLALCPGRGAGGLGFSFRVKLNLALRPMASHGSIASDSESAQANICRNLARATPGRGRSESVRRSKLSGGQRRAGSSTAGSSTGSTSLGPERTADSETMIELCRPATDRRPAPRPPPAPPIPCQ
jgi:hypothetical protein